MILIQSIVTLPSALVAPPTVFAVLHGAAGAPVGRRDWHRPQWPQFPPPEHPTPPQNPFPLCWSEKRVLVLVSRILAERLDDRCDTKDGQPRQHDGGAESKADDSYRAG